MRGLFVGLSSAGVYHCSYQKNFSFFSFFFFFFSFFSFFSFFFF